VGDAGPHAENALGGGVQADHLPAGIEHDHAGLHLLDRRLAGGWQRVKDVKAEQRDDIRCPGQDDDEDRQIEGGQCGQMGVVEQEHGAGDDLSEQHQRHRPAMLRRADEQPEEDGRIEQVHGNPIGHQDGARRRIVQADRTIGPEFQPAPDELRIGDHDHEQAEKARGGQQDQVAAGQPAPGTGVVQDEAGYRGDGSYQHDELELVPGEFRRRCDGGRFERDSQQHQD
jgi:hypothetical protein